MRTARQTAILLAVILNRSGQTRARVSGKTIKHCGLRENLRIAFLQEVIDEIAEFGWILFELGGTGGFGAVRDSALEAARSVTRLRWLTDEERAKSRRDNFSVREWDALEEEATPALAATVNGNDE